MSRATQKHAPRCGFIRGVGIETGKRIRAARGYAGLSRPALGEKLGYDRRTIERRESGAQDPRPGELLAISAICDVPLWFLEEGFGGQTQSEVAAALHSLREKLDEVLSRLGGEDDGGGGDGGGPGGGEVPDGPDLPGPPTDRLRPGAPPPTSSGRTGRARSAEGRARGRGQ